MAEPPRYGESKRHTRPRWVKVSLIIVTVLVLIVAALFFSGVGGDHGPGRHLPGGGGDSAPAPGATDPVGHKPPPGVDHVLQQT
jgi:hypothetical protein